MRLFGKNQEAVDYLTGQLSLLDAEINEFRIYKANYLVNINIHLQISRSNLVVMLTFKDVIEYSFYHNNKHHFYCVAAVPKFVKKENGTFYLSLDPDEMSTDALESDNDIVLSNGLEGYLIEEE
jgi:hypothetical protein